jgi:tripartite tricarboxylate transporter TctB family protein
VTARRAERLSAAVLAALGALSLIEALRLRDDWQGARLMPAVVGAVLVALAVAHLTASMPDTAVAPPHSAGRRRVVLLFGGLVVYVLLLPAAGFGVATALFALALLRALGGYSWARSVVLSALAAAAGELVFRQWLHMPLP